VCVRVVRVRACDACARACQFPTSNAALLDADIELAVTRMQTVIELGRQVRVRVCVCVRLTSGAQARDRRTCPVKLPLMELKVSSKSAAYLADCARLESYIKSELNVATLTLVRVRVCYGR
jgi:isoleucyl-tRNA synthetase